MDDPNENLAQQDPSDEDLRLENDILKLKMQAEFGASFHEMSDDVSPELEQQFLQQVYDFEKAWQNQESVSVASLLENPIFLPVEEIPEDALEEAWQSVNERYAAHNIHIDFIYDYPLEVKYRFATEELPLHDTMSVNVPGMMQGFIYEEFHPNHKADMEDTVKSFLKGWFEQNPKKCTYQLSTTLILATGQMLDKKLMPAKFNQVFESFVSMEETDFFIAETSFETVSENNNMPAMGFVEGSLDWNATMENGETIAFTGPFKFYLDYSGSWSIFYFVMPGFKW